jgi:hypothetical protein
MTTKEQEIADILLSKIRDTPRVSSGSEDIENYLNFMRAVQIRDNLGKQNQVINYNYTYKPIDMTC